MKKGFTLIELLAVIVILAIIALIAVPIVVSIISDSKDESGVRSVDLYIDAVEKAIVKKNYKINYDPDECIIQENTKLKCSKDGEDYPEEIEIDIKGNKPTNGIITIEKGKIVKIKDLLLDNNYYRYKEKIYKTQAPPTNPGLYDEDYNLLATWQELIETYNLDIETNYDQNTYKQSNSKSMYGILKNEKFKNGTVLIMKDDIDNIGSYAFAGCSNLEYIKLPSSISNIKGNTFSDCSNLNNIIIPNGVTYIEGGAFQNCINLEKVIIPNSVTSLGQYSFYRCTKLKYIELPDSITSIWDSSFRECTNLRKIKLSSNITQLRDELFRDCVNLRSIIIPKNVDSIWSSAFLNCSNLESIKVEEGNTVYEDRGINTIIRKETKVLVLGSTKTIIPDDITEIFQNAFYGRNIKSIKIPASITQIGDQAFSKCENLKSVIFENTTGWYLTYFSNGEHTDIDVTNAEVNATNLRSTYKNKQWKRS